MQNDSIKSKYHGIQVEKTTAPDGILGENWYRYVIQKGNLTNSIMEGKKTGSLKSVTAHAKDVVETINSRYVKGGRK